MDNREKSIVTQALLKSVIESGADPKDWERLFQQALDIYRKVVYGAGNS